MRAERMRLRLRGAMRIFGCAVAAGTAGLALLAASIVMAASRIDTCGASRIDAVEPACRLGVQMLCAAYVVLAFALVLGAVSLTLVWRLRRARG